MSIRCTPMSGVSTRTHPDRRADPRQRDGRPIGGRLRRPRMARLSCAASKSCSRPPPARHATPSRRCTRGCVPDMERATRAAACTGALPQADLALVPALGGP